MNDSRIRVNLLLSLILVTTASLAQQEPLTGQMMSGAASKRMAPPPQAGSPPGVGRQDTLATSSGSSVNDAIATDDAAESSGMHPGHVGDVTRRLLQMQADARRHGTPQPMLGEEATLAYRRYLRSFNHDIPDFYEAAVGKHAGDGR